MSERRTPYRTRSSTPAQRGDPHRDLQAFVRDYLERCCGAYVFEPQGWHMQAAGAPDCIACLAGRYVSVEIKTGKAQLHGKQPEVRDRIIAAGGVWILCRRPEDVVEALVAVGLDVPPLQEEK